MSSIADLPTEMLECIFDYLPLGDRKNARLVCQRWNGVLESPHYWERTYLNSRNILLGELTVESLRRAADQGKYTSIRIGPTSSWTTGSTMLLLKACRFSLEQLELFCYSEQTLPIIFEALGTMRELRYLRLESEKYWEKFPIIPRDGGASALLKTVTRLHIPLHGQTHLALVHRLADQLSCLALTIYEKDLLLRCLNELHLPKLRSLSLNTQAFSMPHTETEVLGDECRKTLALLESFQYQHCQHIPPLPWLQHCQNLQCLTLSHCTITVECAGIICAMKELKELTLEVLRGCFAEQQAPLLNLPKLEHLHLDATITALRLGRHLPRLSSVVLTDSLEKPDGPKNILSDLLKIEGLQARRLRKLVFREFYLSYSTTQVVGSLHVDDLQFLHGMVEGSLLTAIARSANQRKGSRILMDHSRLFFSIPFNYGIPTIEELRAKCPHLQIAALSTDYIYT